MNKKAKCGQCSDSGEIQVAIFGKSGLSSYYFLSQPRPYGCGWTKIARVACDKCDQGELRKIQHQEMNRPGYVNPLSKLNDEQLLNLTNVTVELENRGLIGN